MEDFIQMSYLYDVFLRSTAKLPATSRQPEVTYTSCAKLTLLRYSSGLEPGDSSPVYIRPWCVLLFIRLLIIAQAGQRM